MRASVFALVLGGCGFSAMPGNNPNGAPPDTSGDPAADAPPPIDAAPIDSAPLDGAVSPVCLGTFVRVCVDPPSSPVTLTTQELDTSTSARCQPYTATPPVDACVVTGPSITIPSGNTITVTGGRRLILFATGEITIAGTLDVSSRRDGSGPAADSGPCQTNFVDAESGGVGGGGWGGSLGGNGNNGGNGAGSSDGGVAAPPGDATTLSGGCAGGNGGGNGLGVGRGGRGHSGGAVLLLADQAIDVTSSGSVNASGSGGGGGALGGGGGGGGSGGMIVLDAERVDISGQCFANGGGGGEGSSTRSGQAGGESSAASLAGRGGSNGSGGGGDGGNGGLGTNGNANGNPGRNGRPSTDGAGGGGGGGGGGGVIKILSEDQQAHRAPRTLR
ncbi:MAG TPA: hypothetical protein VLM79_30770 [Kofleriaceae bacterium]|nr:hypothetical protein [Kofleriaceae bacterium]